MGTGYLRHKQVAGLNLFEPNSTMKVNMSQMLQATGAAQWYTYTYNQVVVTSVDEKICQHAQQNAVPSMLYHFWDYWC